MPEFLGARKDLFYTVKCDKCSASVAYAPGKTNFNERSVTLSNLVPKTDYTVEIIAENGVSGVARRSDAKITQLSFVTLKSGSSPQASPTKVNS